MNVVFVNSAVEEAREIMARPNDRTDMESLLAGLQHVATDPRYLYDSPEIVRLAEGPAADVFVVREGRARALVMVDPKVTDRVVVASVYLAGEAETAKAAAQ
jgi:hypothetical protein